MQKKLSVALIGALTGSLLWVGTPQASALTIIRNFVAAGNALPGGVGNATAAPSNAVGTGNLADIFNAAADWWEASILTPHTVTIGFGWQGLDSVSTNTLGVHNLLSQSGPPNREDSALIRFDSDGAPNPPKWFLDSTPHDDSEFNMVETTYDDLSTVNQDDWFGGNVPLTLNVGRQGAANGSDPDAQGAFDLLSVAKHEIGHALGLSSANTAFTAENGDGDVDIDLSLFNGGALGSEVFSVDTRNGAHLEPEDALLFPSTSSGTRTLMSDLDVLANSAISQFFSVNLDPHAVVPEPATLATVCLLTLPVFGRRRQAARRR